MKKDPVLEHWNQRALLPAHAGSDDIVAKKLEIMALSKHLRDGMVVAEFGCGTAETAIELATQYDLEMHCFDFSSAMIEKARNKVEEAGMLHRIRLSVCDVRSKPKIDREFDSIYTERMIINLPSWDIQASAIQYFIDHLKPGGRYLMCENSAVGLANLNSLRHAIDLPPISAPWHNLYLADELVASLRIEGARLVNVEQFSATYYFLSRVVNASLAAQQGTQPTYDAPVNRLALMLPPFGDCSQGKLWIFERNHG